LSDIGILKRNSVRQCACRAAFETRLAESRHGAHQTPEVSIKSSNTLRKSTVM
jgi:hypothetical protein